MATRALAAAVTGRRVVGFPALASCRRCGGAQIDSTGRGAHTQAEARSADDHDAAAGVTAAQVEAALNTKNVEEEVAQGAGATTVLPDEAVPDADADAAWVPDQDTGVFVPAEEAAASSGAHGGEAESVLDQTVFNREEEMEDVERPAVDMANAAGAK